MDQQTVITIIVTALVAIVGLVFRYVNPVDPLKSWIEMLFSIFGGIAVALVMGQVPGFVNWGNPLAAVAYILQVAAIVFGFVEIIYNMLKSYFPDAALVQRVFRK